MDTPTTYTSSPELTAEQRGAVLWLTITREERRNAMNHGVLSTMSSWIMRTTCLILIPLM